MLLNIHRYIIHELKKEALKKETILDLSSTLSEIDDFSELLILKLHESFKDDYSTKHAYFHPDDTRVFKKSLTGYIENGFSEQEFLDFTSNSMKDLEADLKKEIFAVGGYFLYADYTYMSKQYIIVTLIRKADGFDMEKVNGALRVKPVQNLNISKLAMGFRLNVEIFNNKTTDKRHYLAIIASKEVSEYFKNWVSAGGVINNNDNTEAFVSIIKGLPLPPKFSSETDFWAAVYDYVTGRSDKTIRIKNVGEYFLGDFYALIAYADENKISIDHEFSYNETTLNKLIEIKVRGDGINLTISRRKISKQDIKTDQGLVIIRSQEVADKLMKQLTTKPQNAS